MMSRLFGWSQGSTGFMTCEREWRKRREDRAKVRTHPPTHSCMRVLHQVPIGHMALRTPPRPPEGPRKFF